MDETEQSKNSGYGKKSVGQWIVIYVIIGAIIYGLVYFFFSAKKGGYNYNQTGQPQQQITTQQPTSGSQAAPTSTSTNQQNTVTLTQDGFSPATLTVKAGETVTWVNKSGTDATVHSGPHPIHTSYPPLNLGSFSNGGTLSLRFDKPGTYSYHNHLNSSQNGTIIVQ